MGEFDNLRCAAAPFVRDFGHFAEAGEEHIDRPGEVNNFIPAFEVAPDQSAFKSELGRGVNEENSPFHTRLEAPEDSAASLTIGKVVSCARKSVTLVNFLRFIGQVVRELWRQPDES